MSQVLIEKFYTALQHKDWKTMNACYHDEATFSDPVFQNLSSKQVKAMWHMLLQSNSRITITFKEVYAAGHHGSCHWEAVYLFSKTGREVHNIIDADFLFKDEKFVLHNDHFDLWRWSGMALGFSGRLFGWTPFMRKKIRFLAQKSLFRFIEDHPEYQ